MDRDDVSDLEQLADVPDAPGVAHGQAVGCVEVHDQHAQSLGQHRELAADVCVADDPQRPAPHLVGAHRRLVPDPGVEGVIHFRQPSGEADHLGESQLDHASGVGERRVEPKLRAV